MLLLPATRGVKGRRRYDAFSPRTPSCVGSDDTRIRTMRSILRSPALIDAWFDTLRPEQRELALVLHDAVSAAAPALATSIKWGNLMFTCGSTHAVAIVMHKSHANLQVFNGALLSAQFPALEGTGRGARHLKFRYHLPVDAALVRSVVLACVDEISD